MDSASMVVVSPFLIVNRGSGFLESIGIKVT